MTSSFNVHDAAGYEQLMGRWSQKLALPFIDFAGLADDERILDVGCGTGSLTFALARNAGLREIAAIDYSPVFVEEATKRNTDPRIEHPAGGCLRPALRGRHVRPRAGAAGAPLRSRRRQGGRRDAPRRAVGRRGRGGRVGPSRRHARHAHDGRYGGGARRRRAPAARPLLFPADDATGGNEADLPAARSARTWRKRS